ncbi:MAG TPA: acyltransferase [Bryobacteraceae bacterium]|nr:acyltransferase [Bryobacteraceae bacterium]
MKKTGESSNLDFLRATAVLFVGISHLGRTFHWIPVSITILGQWGVLMFFLHTSTVLMMSLDRMAFKGWRLFASFYTRRVFRIYPLSIACIVAVLASRIPTAPWELPFHRPSLRGLVSNLGLIMNFTGSPLITVPLWSLPYEIQMYLVLPLLFLCLKAFDSVKAAIFIWLTGTILCDLALRTGSHTVFIPGVPCFLAGVVAYRMRKSVKTPKLSFSVWTAAVLAVTAVVISPLTFHLGISWDKNHQAWSLCLLLGVLVALCKETHVPWLKQASHTIAKYSYGIYLTQVPVMFVAFVWLGWLPMAVRWIAFAILAASLPVLAYHSIERPMIVFGGRLAGFGTRQQDVPQAEGYIRSFAAASSSDGN